MYMYLKLLKTLGLLADTPPFAEHAKIGISYVANLKDGKTHCLAVIDPRGTAIDPPTTIQPLDDDCVTVRFKFTTNSPIQQQHQLSGRLCYHDEVPISQSWTLTHGREEVTARDVQIYVIGHNQK